MILADFRCECGHEWVYEKTLRHHAFPEHPPCPECQQKTTRRVWTKQNNHISVKPGQAGNAANGYSTPAQAKKQ